jgi:hypothetical protein
VRVQSLDMAGFSLTLLVLEPGYLEALAAPTDAPGWPAASVVVDPRTRALTYAAPMPALTAGWYAEPPAERYALRR